MRTSDSPLDPEFKEELSHLFPKLLSDICTEQEMRLFLQSFLTRKELEVFSKRLAIVYWLKRKSSYKDIKEQLKVSSATIASVQDNLGETGIDIAWKFLETSEWAERIGSRIKRIVGK